VKLAWQFDPDRLAELHAQCAGVVVCGAGCTGWCVCDDGLEPTSIPHLARVSCSVKARLLRQKNSAVVGPQARALLARLRIEARGVSHAEFLRMYFVQLRIAPPFSAKPQPW
jgi:hypothetical protein